MTLRSEDNTVNSSTQSPCPFPHECDGNPISSPAFLGAFRSFDEASAHTWTKSFPPAKFQKLYDLELPSHMLCQSGFPNLNDNCTVLPSWLSKGMDI